MTSCRLQLSDRHCRRCDEQASATPRHRHDPARDGGSAGADRCLLADQPRRSPNLPRSRRAAPTSVFLGPTRLPVSVCLRACVRACVSACMHACSFPAGRQTRQADSKYEMKQKKIQEDNKREETHKEKHGKRRQQKKEDKKRNEATE